MSNYYNIISHCPECNANIEGKVHNFEDFNNPIPIKCHQCKTELLAKVEINIRLERKQ